MCCLFGIIDYGHSLTAEQKNRMTSVLATACEARGTDATGIAYNSHGKLTIYKRPLPAIGCASVSRRMLKSLWAIHA